MPLVALESTYASTIAATFTGHLHNDDFRLMAADDGSGAAALLRIAPGISPYLDSNPGYQLYRYDTGTFSLLDETTYTLDLQAAAPAWSREYDYAATYGQSLATPQEWQAVYAGILTNPVSQAAYIQYKNQDATSQNPITAANAAAYLLAPGYVTPAALQRRRRAVGRIGGGGPGGCSQERLRRPGGDDPPPDPPPTVNRP